MNKEIEFIPRKSLYITVILSICVICLWPVYSIKFFIAKNYGRMVLLTLSTLGIAFLTYYTSVSLTTIRMNRDGMFVKRGFKQKFHSWEEFTIISHQRYKIGAGYNRRFFDAILFSTEELKNTKVNNSVNYLVFKNKLNVICVEMYTKEEIKRKGGRFDTIWFEREELLQTLGEWGVKIESQYEDMSVYLKEKEDEPITLKDGIYVKKDRLNEWIVVTEIMQHHIMYQPENKSLYVDGIKRVIKEESIIKLMGIDEEIKLDGKKLYLIIKNNVLRIVYKGKYVDIDEPYIPLKAERLIYFCIPIPILVAIYAAMSKTHALFAVSFALIFVLAVYLKREIKKII